MVEPLRPEKTDTFCGNTSLWPSGGEDERKKGEARVPDKGGGGGGRGCNGGYCRIEVPSWLTSIWMSSRLSVPFVQLGLGARGKKEK